MRRGRTAECRVSGSEIRQERDASLLETRHDAHAFLASLFSSLSDSALSVRPTAKRERENTTTELRSNSESKQIELIHF